MDTTISLKLPPKNYRRIIEELSVVIPDPALKLKFLKQAIDEHQKISAPYKLYPPIAGIAFRKKLLDNAEQIWPGSKKAAKNLTRTDALPAPRIRLLWLYNLRYLIASAFLLLFILGVGTAVSPLVRNFNFGASIDLNSQLAKKVNPKIIIRKPIFYSQRSKSGAGPNSNTAQAAITKKKDGLVSWYYKNPVLTALAFQEAQKPSSNRFSQKSIFSVRPLSSQNHPTTPNIKSANSQDDGPLVPKFLQNPILLALKSQQLINSTSKPSLPPPVWVSRMRDNGNQRPSPRYKTTNYQNGGDHVPSYLQNPILLAMTPQHIKKSKSAHITRKTLVFSKSRIIENPKASPTAKFVKRSEGAGLVPNYLQSPILLAMTPQQSQNAKSIRTAQKRLSSFKRPSKQKQPVSAVDASAKSPNKSRQFPEYLKKPIWLVEKTPDREFYSNRLQIITTYTISNMPREYYRFSKNSKNLPTKSDITDKISGIVYHASESDVYPFMPEMNRSILKYSKQLIKFLLRNKSYHYFIDRFGRVYRLVQEGHAAFHAGNSIWADDEEIYLNLNHAFIGICFEGKDFEEINIRRSKKGQTKKSKSTRLKPIGISSFNEAQMRSGKELTDWLRLKYKISQHNCVPHALTSVNPNRMLIGFHLDLASGFPFARFGLSDKYREPLPSIVEFGFHYDRYFEKIFSGKLWHGIAYAEEILRRQAKKAGLSTAKYRKRLRRRFSRYREWKIEMLEKKNQLAGNLQKNNG